VQKELLVSSSEGLFDTSGKTLAGWHHRDELVEARGMPRALLFGSHDG